MRERGEREGGREGGKRKVREASRGRERKEVVKGGWEKERGDERRKKQYNPLHAIVKLSHQKWMVLIMMAILTHLCRTLQNTYQLQTANKKHIYKINFTNQRAGILIITYKRMTSESSCLVNIDRLVLTFLVHILSGKDVLRVEAQLLV